MFMLFAILPEQPARTFSIEVCLVEIDNDQEYSIGRRIACHPHLSVIFFLPHEQLKKTPN
jgi:hypothetical protein